MKAINEFLSYLRHLDVKLWTEEDRLRYSAPDGTLTPTLLQELRERKSEILAFLQKANLASSSNFDDLRPVPRNADLPLSFAQQRLWFLNQLEGGNAYNTPVALQLTGCLQVNVLEQSLTEIVRRHEALRTNFAVVDGLPMQVIAPPTPVTLAVIDLRALPEAEQSLEVQRLACFEVQYQFDLAKDSLLHATLLQLSDQKHMLLLVMHHIVYDGWSTGILLGELSTLYEAFSFGEPSPLPELPIQYADFTVWQRQWLSGELLQTHLNYWKKHLAGAPPLLELPTDRPRPSVQTFRGNTYYWKLNADLTQKLKSLSQKSGTTLFITLLTAFNILLSRYSGQSDIIVGSPIANRNHSEIESLIGFFVNTLVLRSNLEGNPSFLELLSRVRQVALDAYAHQDLPIEKLVEELQPERSLSYSPLFQVMFALQNAPIGKLELPGLSITSLQLENVTSKFDLSLSMEETEQELRGAWEYNTDLYDDTTITRLTGHFLTLLAGIVANPEQRVSDLPLLTAAEQQKLLVEWNNTQTEYPQDKCIHQLFEEQSLRTPNAVALVFEDQQITYQELNCRANQVAYRLQRLGVGSEVLVGLYVERSIEMIVGLLGILKAGGAYVPLDPNYPQERLTFMLSDSQVPVLLSTQNLMAQLLEYKGRIVCLDTDWEVISQERNDNPTSGVQPDNLAYVIYTSGSTGQPKGVMIQHSSLVNFTETAKVEYELSKRDRVLQFASISFDVAAEEIYPCLTCGGTLVLRTDEMLSSVPEFLHKCQNLQITVLDLPTAYWHQFNFELANANLVLPESLRLVIIGGERALPEQVAIWQKHVAFLPKLVNAYGPTEATVETTLCQLSDLVLTKLDQQEVPIGRPIRNAQVYILDRCLQPVPIGVTGELYIGGDGLARGYLNRPDLTQEKFIPNSFSQDAGSRLYKTGDLARYLPDGNIEFLGRIDNQVKIRGFRIELGEIEAVLSQHSDVQASIVIAREETPGDKCLVAYFVPTQESASIINDLRHFLERKLPKYMVPSAFVMLSALPLTPNGKVDSRALPVPNRFQMSVKASLVLPRNTLELQLTQIWSDILGVYPVGIRDNFFDLGGHSLLAVRLMAQIQQQFGKNLPLATLIQNPNIEDIATILSQQRDFLTWSTLVPIQSHGSKRPLFCVHPAGGDLLCYLELARHLGSDQPIYGFQSMGLNQESEPHTRVEDMANHYIEVLLTFQPQGPFLLAGLSLGGLVAFEMAQQLRARGQQVSFLGLLDTYNSSSLPAEKLKELDDAKLLVSLFEDISLSWEHLRQLESDEQLIYVMEQARQKVTEQTTQINLLPSDFGLAQARRILQIFKINCQAAENYIPQYYQGKVTIFQASEKTSTASKNSYLGWRKLAEEIDSYQVPGQHHTIARKPHVQVLAEHLKGSLDLSTRHWQMITDGKSA